MGFPPDYRLEHGSRPDRIKLLGNAVCPPLNVPDHQVLLLRRPLITPDLPAFRNDVIRDPDSPWPRLREMANPEESDWPFAFIVS
jgi:hypothetical protein